MGARIAMQNRNNFSFIYFNFVVHLYLQVFGFYRVYAGFSLTTFTDSCRNISIVFSVICVS